MGLRDLDIKDLDPLVGNCSVYSLAGGSIRFQDYYNGTWLKNYTTEFLPAYYTTNCSVDKLSAVLDEYFNNQESWEQWTNGLSPPFSQRDNGDAFVALLFTLSGVCVSLWMLTLLLYLLPRHKRNPLLTQLTTVFSSVVCTVLLTQVTELARDEYYNDTLDIFVFREVMFRTQAYRVCNVIAVLLVHLSHLQIVMRITRLWFKYAMTVGGSVLIVVFTVLHGVFEIKYDDADAVVDGPDNSELVSSYAWRASIVSVHLVLQFWFMAALFKFTFLDKNPRKISYALPTLGLGLFTWALILIIFVVYLLSVTTFRHQWWVRLWLDQLPSLLDVALLTIAWEWIYNIAQLEKKHELIGVLGRRMSSDDVASNLGTLPPTAWWKKRKLTWPNATKWLVTPSSEDQPIEIHQIDPPTASNEDSNLHPLNQDPVPVPDLHTADAVSVNSGSTISYNVSMASSSSSNNASTQPPPFVPHPGYSTEDYWHEKS